MKATALLAIIQLMLIGVAALVSGACIKYSQMKWGMDFPPLLPEKMTHHWPWLVVICIGWFAYSLWAELRFQDRTWRHLLPLSLGILYVAFILVLIIGIAVATFFPGTSQTLSP